MESGKLALENHSSNKEKTYKRYIYPDGSVVELTKEEFDRVVDVFREIKRLAISHTRTMVNTPKGNAVIERFLRSLKEECVWQQKFYNFEQAKQAVDKWVVQYNHERPHQTLDYMTPKQYYERNFIGKTDQKVS